MIYQCHCLKRRNDPDAGTFDQATFPVSNTELQLYHRAFLAFCQPGIQIALHKQQALCTPDKRNSACAGERVKRLLRQIQIFRSLGNGQVALGVRIAEATVGRALIQRELHCFGDQLLQFFRGRKDPLRHFGTFEPAICTRLIGALSRLGASGREMPNFPRSGPQIP